MELGKGFGLLELSVGLCFSKWEQLGKTGKAGNHSLQTQRQLLNVFLALVAHLVSSSCHDCAVILRTAITTVFDLAINK